MRRETVRLTCEDFNEYLTSIFGVNHFGDPLFRFIWGQTETEVRLMPWKRFNPETKDFESYYDDALVGKNQPCWILQQWESPEVFGTSDYFYMYNSDPETALPIMEYPEFGRYKDLVTFISREVNQETKQLEIKTIELTWALIDRAIPMLLNALELSDAMKKSAQEAQEAFENAQIVSEISDRLYDSLPAFYGPTSHAATTNRTALIDRKMAEIEQKWRRIPANALRRPARGFYQGN